MLDFGNAMGADALLGLGGGALGTNNGDIKYPTSVCINILGVSKRRQSMHPQSQLLRKPNSVRRQRKSSTRASQSKLLCCFPAAGHTESSGNLWHFIVINGNFTSEDGDACKDLGNDRVAIAFSKFDLDNDGYLSWEEFREVFKVLQYFM